VSYFSTLRKNAQAQRQDCSSLALLLATSYKSKTNLAEERETRDFAVDIVLDLEYQERLMPEDEGLGVK
jgi:hypothetical protein